MKTNIRGRIPWPWVNRGLLVLAVAMLTLLASALPADAQVGNSAVNQYASKFLCGDIASPASPYNILAPGTYNTAVNIHNSNNFNVTIQKKAVLSVIEPGQGRPGARQTHVLLPDASMEVDCTEIFKLLASANPPCAPGIPGGSFCKGYVVVEAARIINTPQGPKPVPAEVDITDILTVKEEDGIWKDYTFALRCVAPPNCPPVINAGTTFRYDAPYNWPDRPVKPACYSDTSQACQIYDPDTLIRQRLGIPINDPNIFIDLLYTDFDTDSRDVALDFEFVTPKRVTYPPPWPQNPCDLQISKVRFPNVPTGGTTTYEITVLCVGQTGSGGLVHVHDLVPNNCPNNLGSPYNHCPMIGNPAVIVGAGTCSGSPPTNQESTSNLFTCDVGPIAASGQVVIRFALDPGCPPGLQLIDQASVDPHNVINEPNEANNTVTETGPPC